MPTPFDLGQYYHDNKDSYAGRSTLDAAQDVFTQNKLGEKFGYKDVYEWLNDPANAQNKAVVQADLKDRMANPPTPQQYTAQAQYNAAPNRGAFTDTLASAGRSLVNVGSNIVGLVGRPLEAVNDNLGRFADDGKGPIPQSFIDTLKTPAYAFRDVYGTNAMPSSKEEMTDKGRATRNQIAGGIVGAGGTMAADALFGGTPGAGVGTLGSVAETYDNAKKEALAAGKSQTEAVNHATKSAAISAATLFLQYKLLGGGFISPFSKTASSELTSGVSKLFDGGIAKNITDYAKAATGGFAANLAETFVQAENRRSDGLDKTTGWEAVKNEAGPSGVVNLVLGAIAPFSHAMARSEVMKTLSDPNAEPLRREACSNMVSKFLFDSGNNEAGGAWNAATKQLIKEGKPIQIDTVFEKPGDPNKAPVGSANVTFEGFPDSPKLPAGTTISGSTIKLPDNSSRSYSGPTPFDSKIDEARNALESAYKTSSLSVDGGVVVNDAIRTARDNLASLYKQKAAWMDDAMSRAAGGPGGPGGSSPGDNPPVAPGAGGEATSATRNDPVAPPDQTPGPGQKSPENGATGLGQGIDNIDKSVLEGGDSHGLQTEAGRSGQTQAEAQVPVTDGAPGSVSDSGASTATSSKSDFYVATDNGFTTVKGTSVDVPGIETEDTFVHRPHDDRGSKKRWVVTEGSTGVPIGEGSTRAKAVANASENAKLVSDEFGSFRAGIDTYLKNNERSPRSSEQSPTPDAGDSVASKKPDIGSPLAESTASPEKSPAGVGDLTVVPGRDGTKQDTSPGIDVDAKVKDLTGQIDSLTEKINAIPEDQRTSADYKGLVTQRTALNETLKSLRDRQVGDVPPTDTSRRFSPEELANRKQQLDDLQKQMADSISKMGKKVVSNNEYRELSQKYIDLYYDTYGTRLTPEYVRDLFGLVSERHNAPEVKNLKDDNIAAVDRNMNNSLHSGVAMKSLMTDGGSTNVSSGNGGSTSVSGSGSTRVSRSFFTAIKRMFDPKGRDDAHLSSIKKQIYDHEQSLRQSRVAYENFRKRAGESDNPQQFLVDNAEELRGIIKGGHEAHGKILSLQGQVDAALDSKRRFGFHFPGHSGVGIDDLGMNSSVKVGLMPGPAEKHVDSVTGKVTWKHPKAAHVIRVWPDKNNHNFYHTFIVDKDLPGGKVPFHDEASLKSYLSKYLSAERHDSGTANKNSADSIIEKAQTRLADVEAEIEFNKHFGRDNFELSKERKVLRRRIARAQKNAKEGREVLPETPSITGEDIKNNVFGEDSQRTNAEDISSLKSRVKITGDVGNGRSESAAKIRERVGAPDNGVVDTDLITQTNKEEHLHLDNDSNLKRNETPDPDRATAFDSLLKSTGISIVYNRDTKDYYIRKKGYQPFNGEKVLTGDDIVYSGILDSSSAFKALDQFIHRDYRADSVSPGVAEESESIAAIRKMVNDAPKKLDKLNSKLEALYKQRDENPSQHEAITRKIAGVEEQIENLHERKKWGENLLVDVSGDEVSSSGGKNTGSEREVGNLAKPRDFEGNEDGTNYGKEKDPQRSKLHDQMVADIDPAIDDALHGRYEALETLLRDYTSSGGKFFGEFLSQELKDKIFTIAPHLQLKYPHLIGRQAQVAFPSGKLPIRYDIHAAGRLAQRIINELRTRFTGSVAFVRSLGDLSPQTRADLVRNGHDLSKLKAFYDEKSGKYVLIADRHSNLADVASSILHEGGHGAESVMFGSKAMADRFFGDVAGVFKSRVDGELSNRGLADTAANRLAMAREVFSDMIGDVQERGDGTFRNQAVATLFQRAQAFVRNGIRAFGSRLGISGLDLHFNEADIRNMVFQTIRGSHTVGRVGGGRDSGFRRTFIDNFQALADLQSGANVDDSSNTHGALGLMRSRIANFINDKIKSPFYSMAKHVQKAGLTADEFSDYLSAVHSVERNRDKIARNSNDQNFAATALQENALHQREITRLENKVGAGRINELRQAQAEFRTMVNKALDHAVAMGYYTPAEATKIRRYPNYVTLRGDLDTSRPGGRLNIDVSKSILRRQDVTSVAGSSSNVIDDTLNTVRRLIVDTEKNYALQYLNNFCKLNPTIGQVEQTKTLGSNTIGVRVGGVQSFIRINNPEVYRALKSLDDVQLPSVLRAFQAYNRFRIKVDLALNPYFAIRNLIGRDTIFGLTNLLTMDHIGSLSGGQMAMRVMKDIPSVLKGLTQITMGSGSQKWGDLYQRYSAAGGKMGFSFLGNDTSVRANLRGAMLLNDTGARAAMTKLGHTFNTWAEHINDISENAIRLATFKHAIDSGLSDFAAANLAKDVSVNFDRRGSISTAMNSLYLYSNAYIQGMDQVAKMIQRDPVKFTGVVSGLAAAGFAIAQGSRALFGDDYDKIPDHIRSKNLVFMTGGDNSQYIKIALPGEFQMFYNVGQYFADLSAGRPTSAATLSLLSNIIDCVNPLGGAQLDSDRTVGQTLAQVATPSALRPILEAFVQTNDRGQHMKWYGGPIKKGKEGEYFVKALAGGLGNVLSQGYNLATGGAKDINDIPLVSCLVGEAPWYMKDQPQSQRFKEAISDSLASLDQYESLSDSEKTKMLKGMTENEKSLMHYAGVCRTQLRILGSRRSKAIKANRVGEANILDGQMRNVRMQFLDYYKRVG